jgi:hypothetical protein
MGKDHRLKLKIGIYTIDMSRYIYHYEAPVIEGERPAVYIYLDGLGGENGVYLYGKNADLFVEYMRVAEEVQDVNDLICPLCQKMQPSSDWMRAHQHFDHPLCKECKQPKIEGEDYHLPTCSLGPESSG